MLRSNTNRLILILELFLQTKTLQFALIEFFYFKDLFQFYHLISYSNFMGQIKTHLIGEKIVGKETQLNENKIKTIYAFVSTSETMNFIVSCHELTKNRHLPVNIDFKQSILGKTQFIRLFYILSSLKWPKMANILMSNYSCQFHYVNSNTLISYFDFIEFRTQTYFLQQNIFPIRMSKSAISSIDKKNFYKLKPDRKTISDTINQETNNNQNLRDIIMDHIIKNLFKQSHKRSPNKSHIGANPYRNKLKKLPIVMEVQINNVKRKIQVDGYSVLQKYIQFEQKNVYRQNNIEPLVVEILNFFDQMQEIADNTFFEVDQSIDLSSHIINIMLEKYHKDRQRANRIKEVNTVKNKTIAKYTRVSYLDIQNHLQKKQCQIYVQKAVDSNHNSHRVSRDTIYSSTVTEKDTVQTKDLKNSKSRLKDLVDKYKVFQHPEKIEQLRKQKLSQTYDAAQIQKITQSVIRQNSSCNDDANKAVQPSKGYGQNQSCIDFLQNWICQITISQKLYRSKIQQRQDRNKQTDIKVGKIIEQSQDEDEKQNQQENADNINQQHA